MDHALQFKLVGNWELTAHMLRSLPRGVRNSALWGQRKWAQRLLRVVKGHLLNQDLNWPSASPSSQSRDKRLLIDSGTYLRSITLWQKAYSIHVGVRRGVYEPNGEEVAFIATLHEVGAKGVPQRELWGPSFEELGGREGIRQEVRRNIARRLVKDMGSQFEVNT